MIANTCAMTVRHQLRKPPRKPRGRKTAPMFSVVQRTARGEQIVALPNALCQSLDWMAGRRIWFRVHGNGVTITLKPWGPYPVQGRRVFSRICGRSSPVSKPSRRRGKV